MQSVPRPHPALGLLMGLLLTTALGTQATVVAGQTQDRININTASVEQLTTLPRIGPVVAQRIIDYRETNGEFKTTRELLNVRGIGEKVYRTLKDRITVTRQGRG